MSVLEGEGRLDVQHVRTVEVLFFRQDGVQISSEDFLKLLRDIKNHKGNRNNPDVPWLAEMLFEHYGTWEQGHIPPDKK